MNNEYMGYINQIRTRTENEMNGICIQICISNDNEVKVGMGIDEGKKII